MCGIVGILGRGPVAEQTGGFAQAPRISRLRFRRRRHAGRRPSRAPPRRRQAEESRDAVAGRAADRPHRHRPHPLGHPRQADREQRASACDRPRRRGSQRHHREFPRIARSAAEEGRGFHRPRPTPRSCCIWSTAISLKGFKPVEAVKASLSQLRGAFALGVHLRRRRRSDDRRAQRAAARDRLWRRRDVSRLGRDRARPVHRHHQLSRGRRLGGADPQQRRDLRQEQRGRSSRRDQAQRRDVAGRQGELSPLHGQGNSRAAGSGRPHAGALRRHGDRARGAAGQAAVRLQGHPAHLDHRLRHRELCRLRRQILVRAAWPPAGRTRCRLRIPLPRGAAAQGRSRDLHFAIRRDRRHAGGAALRQGAGRAHALGRQRADLDDRARKRDRAADAGRSGDRRRLDQGVHLPADGAGRASRSPPARRAANCPMPTKPSWCMAWSKSRG